MRLISRLEQDSRLDGVVSAGEVGGAMQVCLPGAG